MFGMGIWEVLLIFLVILLLFGAKRLPEIGSSLGKGIREFKGSLNEIERELRVPDDEERSSPRRLRSEGVPPPRERQEAEARPAAESGESGKGSEQAG